MKALLLRQYGAVEMVDMPVPEPAEDELLVRVRACGICGSDVHGLDGSTGRRIPPIVMGHEAAGVVERVGAFVDAFSPGERVTFDSTISCGRCGFCRAGRMNLCDNRRVLGVSCGDYRRHGAFAEYVVVPQHVAYRLPDGLPFEHAAMIEAVSIAVHATARAAPRLGDAALVVGAGMIGQLVIQALRLAGCRPVIAADIDPTRLELARRLGADHTVDARSPDAARHVVQLTGGRGADVAMEVVGAAAALRLTIDGARKGGTVVLVGNSSPTVELALQAAVSRELDLRGSCASNGEYPLCIELLASGRIDVRPLLSAVAPLEEGPRWFGRLYAREPGLMKVVLVP